MVKEARDWLRAYWLPVAVSVTVGLLSGAGGSWIAVQVALARHDERLQSVERVIVQHDRQIDALRDEINDVRVDVARLDD